MRANGSPPRKRRDDAPPRLASRLSLATRLRDLRPDSVWLFTDTKMGEDFVDDSLGDTLAR